MKGTNDHNPLPWIVSEQDEGTHGILNAMGTVVALVSDKDTAQLIVDAIERPLIEPNMYRVTYKRRSVKNWKD